MLNKATGYVVGVKGYNSLHHSFTHTRVIVQDAMFVTRSTISNTTHSRLLERVIAENNNIVIHLLMALQHSRYSSQILIRMVNLRI
jgi:hypothetical protein